MSQQAELLDKLIYIADNPENEFDKIIKKNKIILRKLNEKNLAEIYMLRKKCIRLCSFVPYKRNEIAELVDNNEVKTNSVITKLEDYFVILEHIFEIHKNI